MTPCHAFASCRWRARIFHCVITATYPPPMQDSSEFKIFSRLNFGCAKYVDTLCEGNRAHYCTNKFILNAYRIQESCEESYGKTKAGPAGPGSFRTGSGLYG